MEESNEKVWVKKNFSKKEADYIAKELNISKTIAELLVSVGISTKEEVENFLRPNYKTQIHNPYLLRDMNEAVKRVNQAIDNNEKILIHGDYDADGCTTIALGKQGFELLGVEVDTYAPNRFSDGYGLNPENMKQFLKEYDLIISGDTGIRAFEAGEIIENGGGADLIITDHHEPLEGFLEDLFLEFENKLKSGKIDFQQLHPTTNSVDEYLELFHSFSTEEKITIIQNVSILPKSAVIEILEDKYIALPKALAVINPQRLGDSYPCKTLAGVAVMFKLLQAVFMSRKEKIKPLFYLLDLVAVGCIADLAQQIDRSGEKLDFEVRTMCRFGIEIMNRKPKPWVQAIIETKNLKPPINSGHIGFQIGPMLNAPGRLDDPKPSVDILLAKTLDEALVYAEVLKQINDVRQRQTKAYIEIAEELRKEGKERYDYGIAVQSDKYGIGIAGLVAGKLSQEFYRPALALSPVQTEDKLLLKGSARSIPGIHILRVLDKVREEIGDYIYGGHEQAAGITIEAERFDDFKTAFRKYCMMYDEEIFIPKVFYNIETTIDEMTLSFMGFLVKLEPFGEGNKKPIFRSNEVLITEVKQTKNENCLIFTFEQNNSTIKGITFQNGKEIYEAYQMHKNDIGGCKVDILFSPSINEWNNTKKVQLELQDIKFY